MSRADASRAFRDRQRPWGATSGSKSLAAGAGLAPASRSKALTAARAASTLAIFGVLALPGCWAHDRARPASAPDPRTGVHLLAPTSGRYVITRDGDPIGEETFTVTATGARWRAEGTIHLTAPVEQRERYRLDLDPRTNEPLGFELELELEGETERAVGRRDGDYIVVDGKTIAGAWTRRVPYGRGTAIDLGTPLATTLVTSLLGPSLQPKAPALVRTILVAPPALEPAIVVVAYELHDRQGDTIRLVASSGEDRTALWIRPDGLPIRTRMPTRAGVFEHRLE